MNDPVVMYDMAKAIGEEIRPQLHPFGSNHLVCIKTDFEYLEVLSTILPSVKAIVVVRDGRAVAHSMTSHDILMQDFDTALNYWSESLTVMLDQCYTLGSEMCMIMIYEKLVVDTEVWLKATTDFAGLLWNPNVLNHSKIVGDQFYEK